MIQFSIFPPADEADMLSVAWRVITAFLPIVIIKTALEFLFRDGRTGVGRAIRSGCGFAATFWRFPRGACWADLKSLMKSASGVAPLALTQPPSYRLTLCRNFLSYSNQLVGSPSWKAAM